MAGLYVGWCGDLGYGRHCSGRRPRQPQGLRERQWGDQDVALMVLRQR